MSHLPLFATPIAVYDVPGMDQVNRELTSLLVAESQTRPSVHRSNIGSWHSDNLAGRPEPCVRAVVECIVGRVRETVHALVQESGQGLPTMRVGVHGWAMVMRHGHYTIPHNHADAHWGTVYYADAGDADETNHPASGLLAFIDPRQAGRPIPGLEITGTTYTVQARSGRLVVFPGWLLHYVHTYLGRRPRVSISCNVVFEPVAELMNDRKVRAA